MDTVLFLLDLVNTPVFAMVSIEIEVFLKH